MFAKSVLAAGLAGVAAAVPTYCPSQTSELVKANFDDLFIIPELPTIQPVGVYKQLEYKSFDKVELGLVGITVTGVKAKSGVNVIGTSITNQVVSGAPEILATEDVPSFDLKEFYFGCVVDTVVSAASLPEKCTVTVDGYDANGKGIANQEIRFAPDAALSNMGRAVLSHDFKGLARVKFTTDTTLATLTATLYDSFTFEYNHPSSCHGHY